MNRFSSRVLLVLLVFTCFVTHSAALDAQTTTADNVTRAVKLWDSEPPGFRVTGEQERDTSTPESRKVAGRPVVRLGGVSSPEMHLYLPDAANRTETAVVICPGGGYSILAWDLEGTEVAEWLQSIGVTAVVLKYRVPTRDADPRWMAPTMDAQRAVRLVRSLSKQQDWNVRRVGILGFSAGGHTAARAAVAKEAYYPPQDDTDRSQAASVDFAVLVYPAYLLDDQGQLDPELEADTDTPPMFFAHARDDRISCEGSIEMYQSLVRAGVSGELHIYASGGHGFGMRTTDQPCSQWPQRCEDWMRSQGWLAQR